MVVPAVAVLIVAGLHVPVIPLLDVPGNAGALEHFSIQSPVHGLDLLTIVVLRLPTHLMRNNLSRFGWPPRAGTLRSLGPDSSF